MLKFLYAFLVALPDLIQLVKIIREEQQAKADSKRVKEKLKLVKQAFKEKNADALNRAFSDN